MIIIIKWVTCTYFLTKIIFQIFPKNNKNKNKLVLFEKSVLIVNVMINLVEILFIFEEIISLFHLSFVVSILWDHNSLEMPCLLSFHNLDESAFVLNHPLTNIISPYFCIPKVLEKVPHYF